MLALDHPQWIRHLEDLVGICDNIDRLVVFVAELSNRQRFFTVANRSANEQGGVVNLFRFYFDDLFEKRVIEDFKRLDGVKTPFTDADRDTSFQFGLVPIARNGCCTHCRMKANWVHSNAALLALKRRSDILRN